MTFGGFIILLLIAAITGGIGQQLSGYSHGGCFVSVLVGFIGAWLGPIIAKALDFPLFFTIDIQGKEIAVIWAIIGSALVSLVLGTLTKKPQKD